MKGRTSAYFRRLASGLVMVVTGLLIARVTNVAAGTEMEGSAFTRISDLRRENQALASRVTKLEESLGRLSSAGVQPPSRVQAPFEVVDAAGNSLLLVSGDPVFSGAKKARVTIGRGSGENFLLAIRNAAGTVVASMA